MSIAIIETKSIKPCEIALSGESLELVHQCMETYPTIYAVFGCLFNAPVRFSHQVINERYEYGRALGGVTAESLFELPIMDALQSVANALVRDLSWEKECWSIQFSLCAAETTFVQFTWRGNVANVDGDIFPVAPPHAK